MRYGRGLQKQPSLDRDLSFCRARERHNDARSVIREHERQKEARERRLRLMFEKNPVVGKPIIHPAWLFVHPPILPPDRPPSLPKSTP